MYVWGPLAYISSKARKMKRSPFRRKSLEEIKEAKKAKKNRPLKLLNHESSADLKKDIQALVRQIAIIRDGGCILRLFPEAGQCGGYRNDGELILQAEHLVTRSNSATYGDMRNIVCLCAHHHGHFKPQYSRLYWDIIRKHLGEERWEWIEKVEADKSPHKVDWKLVKLSLEQDLKRLV